MGRGHGNKHPQGGSQLAGAAATIGRSLRRWVFFNRSYAVVGSVNMGAYVFLVNLPEGFRPAAQAGAAQAVLSFLIAGYNIGFFEFLAPRSIPAAILFPTLLTSTLATAVHYANGTPALYHSWCVVAGLALFRFSVLSRIHTTWRTIAFSDLFRIVRRRFSGEAAP